MHVSTSETVLSSREVVWSAITDIEASASMISGILNIDVLDKPAEGLVGLKRQETRKMFGKESTETMWITDAVENEYYYTRAESHGCVYVSRLMLSDASEGVRLTMSFSGKAKTLGAKILSAFMGFFITGSLKKELDKDLSDTKRYVEQSK